LVASQRVGSLATLSADGSPWASIVTYGVLPRDGSPVLYVSSLAEHGRNLVADARASLVVAEEPDERDPLDRARVTLAGRAERVGGEREGEARSALPEDAPGFDDFALWVLRVDRVRWVGGYGRMGSAAAGEYRAAEPDPVAPIAARAAAHLNDDHADALLDIAHVLGGRPDAAAARCTHIDRYGIDLDVAGDVVRVDFPEPLRAADDLRSATVKLARRAQPS
jgi:putative heme iron utilization protein